jgi:hypothetical protein
MNNATILKNEPDITDFQWKNERGGDAMIFMGEQTLVPVDEDDFDMREILKPSSKKRTGRDGTEKKKIPTSITLGPHDSFKEETVDACLESLKLLRDTGVIAENKYNERRLRLFRQNRA